MELFTEEHVDEAFESLSVLPTVENQRRSANRRGQVCVGTNVANERVQPDMTESESECVQASETGGGAKKVASATDLDSASLLDG